MLSPSVATANPFALLMGDPLPKDVSHDLFGTRTVHLQDLPTSTQLAIRESVEDGPAIPGLDDSPAPPWSEKAIVDLHLVLLKQLVRLEDPETPLAEKLDTLAWVFTEPEKDERPFSFVQCVRVVGLSPLSETAFFGLVDIDEIRHWIDTNARRWIRATISRYPTWAQEVIRTQPDFVVYELLRDPQWLNKQIKARENPSTGDLFSNAGAALAS